RRRSASAWRRAYSAELAPSAAASAAGGTPPASTAQASRPAARRMASALLGLALGGHRRHGGLDLGRIAQVVVADRPQVVVQLVDQGLAGGDVEVHDLLVGD